MQAYKFSWNGRNKLIQGLNESDAKAKFMERFGFYPSEELVTIEISSMKSVG